MGRKRNILFRKFYIFDSENNVSECKICKSKLTGSYVSNLKRHLELKHKSEFQQEILESDEPSIDEKKTKFSVTLNQAEVKHACIGLVTSQKLPFAVFDSKDFKTLTAQIFSGLNMPPVTSRSIMSLVDEEYIQIKTDIMKKLKNRMICLKIDTATRCNRGILGVNVQYIHDGTICVRTLGLIELKKAHTSKNLCMEINTLLKEFYITKGQIYTVTTDNGRNMVKTVDLLNDNDDEDDSPFHLGENVEVLDAEELTKDIKILSILSIKCAAHTLQLAVKDFLQSLESVAFIEKARKIAKLLRTPSYRYLISEQSLPQPVLDVPTRWNSTYNMLNMLVKFEEFCEKHIKKAVRLTSSEWNDLKSLVETLEPANHATEKLQNSQLFMGDFYMLWLELKLTVQAGKSCHSQALSQCIIKREEGLLGCNSVICSIYLDPRIRRVLLENPVSLMVAKSELKQLFLKIIHVNQSISESMTSSPEEKPVLGRPNEIHPQTSNKSSLLKEYLNKIEVPPEEEVEDGLIRKGYAEIDGYMPKPISLETNIMDYWEENKFQFPNLYELAKVVHSTPATQVSVERSFSALKLMLTDQRCNLGADSLQKLMFVKLNKYT